MNNLRKLSPSIFLAVLAIFSFACKPNPAFNSVPTSNPNTQKNTETKLAESQTIKFTSVEKLEIIGTFYESPKASSPAVLLLHQWQSNRKSYDNFAKQLQATGFGVLAIDGRGFGESVKTADGKTVSPSRTDDAVKAMKADVDNAFNFLKQQKNVNPSRIGIVGASYGSSLAIIYGAENTQIKAVALLSPGLNYFGNMPIEDAVKNYGERSLLLVAADDDKESAETVKTLKQINEKYETKIYLKGGHGTALFAANLEDLLEEFLVKNL
jgi:dienelactone hydrolase